MQDISDMIIQSSMWCDFTHTMHEVMWTEEEETADSKTPTHNLVTTLTMLFHCLIEIKTPSYWNFFFISSKRLCTCHTWWLKVKTFKQPFQLIHVLYTYWDGELRNIITAQCQSWSCINAEVIFGKLLHITYVKTDQTF